MTRALPWLAAALALLALPSCMQRIDAALRATAAQTSLPVHWAKAGEFGGDAVLAVDSPDPYARRYTPGRFLRIAGLDVTAAEVWVCDTALSRIQVFDYQGELLRTYGSGAPVEGTLISDEQLLYESEHGKDAAAPWEDGAGQRWIGAERELFRVADVAVTPTGYWAADWAMSKLGPQPKRKAGVYFVPFDGGAVQRINGGDQYWVGYLALSDGTLAACAPPCNHVDLFDLTKQVVQLKALGADPPQTVLLKLRYHFAGDPGYVSLERKLNEASYAPGSFNQPCGVALAFDKLAVCDTGNARLQVFEARNRGEYWGRLLRLIMTRKVVGTVRFEAPRDIAVAASGQVFILDAGRNEVGLLSPDFERLGSFARRELSEPWQIAVSPDGRHCFITDKRSNTVLHYAAQD